MVSLLHHEQHSAWQQRVKREINEAFKYQTQFKEPMRPCFTPPKVIFATQSPANRPNSKGKLYSNLPASNINTAALSLYGEVRGKYSRNAFKTMNSLPNTAGLVSRPSTAGSLHKYSRKGHSTDSRKGKPEEDSPGARRPLPCETRVHFADEVVNDGKYGKREEVRGPYKEDGVRRDGLGSSRKDREDGAKNEAHEDREQREDREPREPREGDERKSHDERDELIGEEDIEENDFGKKTEVSFKTGKSQIRYIEELEKLIQEERIRRIQAEEKFQKKSFTHRKKRN